MICYDVMCNHAISSQRPASFDSSESKHFDHSISGFSQPTTSLSSATLLQKIKQRQQQTITTTTTTTTQQVDSFATVLLNGKSWGYLQNNGLCVG